jgi:serine/threonine-protein kinase
MRNEANGAEFANQPGAASREALVREQLERILASPGFQGASRRTRLLRYLVGEVLEGRGNSLKELVIATEVFERTPDYDPQVDSLVRVEMGRLRSRLQEYYGQAGTGEPVRIEIPKGGYRPVFAFRDPLPETAPGPAADRIPEPVVQATRSGWQRWKWIVAGIGGAAAVAAAVWLLRTTAPPLPRSIAVLPFLNLSGDPANEYLGDGISEEVTEALAQSSDLRVVSRTSAFQYKGKSADVREVGQRLGARAVLEGSVGRRGEKFHVVAQLIRASDGYHLWSDVYDAGVVDLPSVEARIGQAVREKLSVSPPPIATATDSNAVNNPEAHDLYLRSAFEFNRRTVDSTKRAMELAQQAVQKDPPYAQPYVLMASAESQLSTLFAESPHVAAQRAREELAKALQLDPGNNGAHAQLAMLAYTNEWDWPKAEREFRLALATGSHGSAENLYGWCLMTRGRFAEARKHLENAAELDPLSLGPQLNQVEEMLTERDYAGAKRKVDRVLETAPSNFVALALAFAVALAQGDCPDATQSNQKLLATYPQSPYAHLTSLGADGFCGHPERVEPKLAEILSGHPPGFLSPYAVATVYGVRGDAGRAMDYLHKSADLREPTILMLMVERAFDHVRQDSRFVALERQVGLVE